MVAACQKSNNVLIDSSAPVAANLTYFDYDSVDIGYYLDNKTALTLSDSFQVTISPASQFDHLLVQVTNDSGIVVNSASYDTLSANKINGIIVTTFPSVYVGNVTYKFTPYNHDGTAGSFSQQLVRFFDSNLTPPVIDSVTAPDSVLVGSTISLSISMQRFRIRSD